MSPRACHDERIARAAERGEEAIGRSKALSPIEQHMDAQTHTRPRFARTTHGRTNTHACTHTPAPCDRASGRATAAAAPRGRGASSRSDRGRPVHVIVVVANGRADRASDCRTARREWRARAFGGETTRGVDARRSARGACARRHGVLVAKWGRGALWPVARIVWPRAHGGERRPDPYCAALAVAHHSDREAVGLAHPGELDLWVLFEKRGVARAAGGGAAGARRPRQQPFARSARRTSSIRSSEHMSNLWTM